jgi:very-short-patch-repair endonuclease
MTPTARTRRARGLRRDATAAERKLWVVIGDRRLGGHKFRRQYPVDRYFADFACPAARLIIELDGGQHHEDADYDAKRSEELMACGWRVLRFWNTEVMDNVEGVADTILAELRLRAP